MPRARVGAIELEYEVGGSPHGAAVLLIGGLGSQLISWDDDVCAALTASGHRFIRYDNRDTGLSTVVSEAGAPDLLGVLLGSAEPPYRLGDLASDALGLLDHLGVERAHLVGLSMGGMIAQLLALDHPERVASVVALLSGPPGRPESLPEGSLAEVLLRPPGSSFEELVESAVELRRALANGGDGFEDAEARARARAQIRRAHHPAGTLRQVAAVLGTPSRADDLSDMPVPTLYVHGDRDPLVSYEAAERAATTAPAGVLLRLRDTGHDLPRPLARQVIEEATRFWRALG